MITEYIWVIQIIVTLATGVMGWFLRELWSRIKHLDSKIQDTRENYAHKDDIQNMKEELVHRLTRVENLIIQSIGNGSRNGH